MITRDEPIIMKDVPEQFVLGKPFLTIVQLYNLHFPIRRLHRWYMVASSLGVMNITFCVSNRAFKSGDKVVSLAFEDLWNVYHQKRLDVNYILLWSL